MKRVIVGHGLVGQALKRAMPDAYVYSHREHTELFHCDELYMAAARVGGVAENNARPADFMEDNVATTLTWLRWARLVGVERTLLFGSVCMYPRNAPLPHREEHLGTGDLEPTNRAYAMAKLCILEAARAYHKQYGTKVSFLIPSNLYGPGDKSTHAIPEIIAKIKRAKETGEPPRFYSGLTIRQFLHVDDLARACLDVVQGPYDGPEPYNVGPGDEPVTMAYVVKIVADTLGYRGDTVWNTGPAGAPNRSVDTRRIRALGWKPRIKFEEGLLALCK